MLEAGLQPLFADLDVVWLANPVPFVRRLPAADILISLDLLAPNQFDGGLERCPDVLATTLLGMMNVGIHLMRPGALPAVQAWADVMEGGTHMEQVAFNLAVQDGMRNAALPGERETPLCRALDGRVVVGLLPPSHFVNGHLFFTQHLLEWPESAGLTPVAMHATFVTGRQAKRHFLREHGLWQADPPERFHPTGGFLTFDISISPEMLTAAGPPEPSRILTAEDARGHIALMNHQLSALGAAMQLSQLLGRQLIVPQLWCGLDSSFMDHDGRWPGTRPYPLPFPCPLGHAVRLDRWLAEAAEGRLPMFHEAALLEHPLMFSKSRLEVAAATSATNGRQAKQRTWQTHAHMRAVPCTHLVPGAPASGCRLEVHGRLGGQQLQALLQDYNGVDILHFSDIIAVWEERSQERRVAFANATKELLEPWCCAQGNRRLPLSF